MNDNNEKEINKENEDFMARALELATEGMGHTLPNPMVGAVIVRDGRIIGEGFHEAYGSLHAERNALASVIEDPAGADMYVTLEPCDHHGKTPPCTEAIIDSGIKRVFTGSSDPNPKVSGKGIEHLRREGIEVVTDVLKDKCDNLNKVFFHHIQTGLPYICMKYAMTADGKITTKAGESKWISNEGSRQMVHEMRREYPAIMVGVTTVINDDPMLTYRPVAGKIYSSAGTSLSDLKDNTDPFLSPGGGTGRKTVKEDGSETVNPVRIICDSSLRIPEGCKIAGTAQSVPTFAACAIAGLPEGILVKAGLNEDKSAEYLKRYPELVESVCARSNNDNNDLAEASDDHFDIDQGPSSGTSEFTADKGLPEKITKLKKLGIGIINVPDNGKVDLKKLACLLGSSGIAGILLEGGGTVNYSALAAGIVNEVCMFIGSKIVGGTAKSPVMGKGVDVLSDAFPLKLESVSAVGDDVMVRYIV